MSTMLEQCLKDIFRNDVDLTVIAAKKNTTIAIAAVAAMLAREKWSQLDRENCVAVVVVI